MPKLTNLLITTDFAKCVVEIWLDWFTIRVDYTIVLKKQDRKAAKFFGVWLVGLKSLQDADAQAVDIIIAYFNNCQRNKMG